MTTTSNIEIYKQSILNLLPQGIWWQNQQNDPTSDINKIALSLAYEINRIQTRTNDLLNESSPITAVETISQWEIDVGITPNELIPLEKRRRQIIIKLLGDKVTQIPKLIFVATLYDTKINITSLPPPKPLGVFRCGNNLTQKNVTNVLKISSNKLVSSDLKQQLDEVKLANTILIYN